MNLKRVLRCDYCRKKKKVWGIPKDYRLSRGDRPVKLVRKVGGRYQCAECRANQELKVLTGKVSLHRRARLASRVKEAVAEDG